MKHLSLVVVSTITLFLVINRAEASPESLDLACGELEAIYEAHESTLTRDEASILKSTGEHYCALAPSKIRFGMTLIYSNGQIAVDMLGLEGSSWYLPNGKRVEPNIISEIYTRKEAKILAPFKKYHSSCSGGCEYISWGIWGDEAHKKRLSCHNSGEAIDIHALVCSKVKYSVKTTKFQNYLKCMRNHFGIIYGNAQHKNHAHVELKPCKKIKLK